MRLGRAINLTRVIVFFLCILSSAAIIADDEVERELGADQVKSELGLTGDGTIVAILDRGIDWSHPDLSLIHI